MGELSGVPVALSENPTHVNENNETLEQRRSIILEQDKAYNESLQADRKLTKIAFFSVYMYIYFMVVCPIDNTCMWCNTCIRKKEEDEKIHN